MQAEKTAVVFDIGRFRNAGWAGDSDHYFLQGVPSALSVVQQSLWAGRRPQLVVNPAKCTGCGRCVEPCPRGVNTVVPGEKVVVDFSACTACGACVPACPGGARTLSGQAYTARQLYQEAAKDAAFYRKGGGGVTLSGGEVLLQYEVAAETLRLCRTNYLNTCIETSAYAPWDHLWQVAQYCHTVFVDLKHMDSTRHQAMSGVGNGVILDNLTRLCRSSLAGGQGDRPDAPHPRVQRRR